MHKLTRVAAALFVILGGCPKRVSVNGQEMSASEAQAEALRELARFQDETTAEPPASAAERYEALAARFGEVPAAADALFEAGVRWGEAGKPDRARAAFARILERWPLSPRASPAKYQLALSDAQAGKPKDALATLSSLYDTLPTPQKPEAAQTAAASAEKAKAWAEAARWHAEAARVTGGAESPAELAKAMAVVEGQLGLADLVALEAELPADSQLLPAVTMRLARIQLHVHEDEAAERTAREVSDRWPASPYAAEARALLERLTRRSQVDVHAIGVAVPLSGKLKAWGDAILQGVALAIGDRTPAYHVVVRDTRGEPDGAQTAMEELAAEGVVAVLGGVTNAEALRAASAAQEAGLPFVSLAKVESVTQVGPFVFRNMLTAEAQVKAVADLALARRGMKRFAVLWPQVPYGQELANAFWDEVEARGGEVRAAESYEFDRTTFAPVVKSMVGKLWLEERQDYQEQVKEIAKGETDPYRRRKAIEKARDKLPPAVDFDAVFLPDFAKNVALIAPALAVEDVVTQTCDPREVERIRRITGREDLRPVQLLGTNGWDDPSLVERAGRYVECAIFVDGFFPASERADTKAFVSAFATKYGHPPSILEASAFDAAGMIREVLERGAASREDVRSGLSSLKGFKGATGDLAFDARREVAKALFYLTVVKGALRELTPQELAAPGAGGS
jgi:ABC-type branched-subunit amino acid transport system substrate-binding protein